MDAELQQYRKRSRGGAATAQHAAALGLAAAGDRPARLRHRAQLQRRGAGDGHGDRGRRHRGALPDHRPRACSPATTSIPSSRWPSARPTTTGSTSSAGTAPSGSSSWRCCRCTTCTWPAASCMRCVRELGAVGSFIRPNLLNGHYWHSNYWDPALHRARGAERDLGLPRGRPGAWYSHMNELYGENRFYRHVASHWIEMQQALIAMIIGGVFEFHPKLRVGFLEAQNSWVPGTPVAHRVGLPAVPRHPRPVSLADAEGVLPAQLLGRGRRQRAGDRGDRRA